MKLHSIAASGVLLRRRFYVLLVFVWLLGACGVSQKSSERADQKRLQGEHLRVESEWAANLNGRWLRAADDEDGETTSTPAAELRFDGRGLHESWKDGTERAGRWQLMYASDDVVHMELDSEGLGAQVWRLFLAQNDEIVLFLPGHEPVPYHRADSLASTFGERGADDAGGDGAGIATPTAGATGIAASAVPPNADFANASSAPAHDPAATNASAANTLVASASAGNTSAADTTPGPPALSEELLPQEQALYAQLGAPTQEALERQMRSVGVAMGHSERKLGERLVIGVWRMSVKSLTELDGGAAAQHSVDGVTLRFSARGMARLETVLAGVLTIERGVWALEGMYGPEVRVILTLEGSSPRRERMLFLDIDRFVLSPQDGALTFDRKRL